MGLKDDDVSCVVVFRETPSRDWELCTRTLRKSVAFRSAYMMQEQERTMGHKRFQAGVMLAEDWDAGRRKVLKPPAGFEDELDQESAEIAAKIEQRQRERPEPQPEPEYAPPAPKALPPPPEPEPEPSKKMIYDEPEL